MKRTKYGLAKQVLLKFPQLREKLASSFMSLPDSLSPFAYDVSRSIVFRDNARRLPAFDAAFTEAAGSNRLGDYLEFGVARGTSLISAYKLACRDPRADQMRFHAFDSFEGLPSSEGDFVEGDMSYGEATFLRFIQKAGVDTNRVTRTKGFFDTSLSPGRADELLIEPGRAHVVHIDCDLYTSTVPVLSFLKPLLGPGSVIVFDDWFSFEEMEKPWQHGEQKAFQEWDIRDRFDPIAVTYPWNAAFMLRR